MAECKTWEFTHHSRAITNRVFPDVLANSDGPALTRLELTIHMADNEANTLVSSLMSDRADSPILEGVSSSVVLPGV